MINIDGETETPYYYHFDGLGSVIALTDSGGTVAERYSYNVSGTPYNMSRVGNRFMFTGREYDYETGNYYMRARYYDPWLGRFLNPDPIGYADSMNLYQYCLNNPVNWTDPWGLRTRNNLGGWLYNRKETEAIVDRGRGPEPWSPWQHSNSAVYDFAHGKHQKDTFTPPPCKSQKTTLTATEFGNYLGGYLGTYHMGMAGYLGMRAAGNWYANPGWRPSNFLTGDDTLSIRDIDRGANDALQDSPPLDPAFMW
jgi:RHS repeat-associated protein